MTAARGPKRHHWVPQMILKRFAADDPPTAIHVFDKRTRKLGCWKIIDVAVEGHRYPDLFEGFLSQHEAEIAPILSRWAGAPDEPLTEYNRQNIALFIAFLYLRTPSASAFVQQHSRQLVSGLAELSRTDPSALREMREMVVASDPTASTPSIEELELALQREDPLCAIEMVPRVATLLAMMPVEAVFHALLRMQWQILVPPPGQAFWISDAATIVRAVVDQKQIIVGGGIGLPGADIFVPLGARFALHASNRRGPTTRMIDHEELAALIRLTTFYADRFVFSPAPFDADDPIVASARSEPRPKVDERVATEQWTDLLRRVLAQR